MARLAIYVPGCVLLTAGISWLRNETGVATVSLIIGSGLVVVGATLPYIKDFVFGPKGMSAKLDYPGSEDSSTKTAPERAMMLDDTLQGVSSRTSTSTSQTSSSTPTTPPKGAS